MHPLPPPSFFFQFFFFFFNFLVWRQATAKNLLHDFEQSGIFLADDLRDHVVDLQEAIQTFRITFEQGVGGSTQVRSKQLQAAEGSI